MKKICLSLSDDAIKILDKIPSKSKGLFVSICILEMFKTRKDLVNLFLQNATSLNNIVTNNNLNNDNEDDDDDNFQIDFTFNQK